MKWIPLVICSLFVSPASARPPLRATTTPSKAELAELAALEREPPEGKLNLNLATEDELQQLDGVTRANAKLIVAWRRVKGPFVHLADLGRVPALPPKLLQTVRYFVTTRFDANGVAEAALLAARVPKSAADALLAARRKRGSFKASAELDRVAGLSADERELLRGLLWFPAP